MDMRNLINLVENEMPALDQQRLYGANYDSNMDQGGLAKLSDTRKPRITLAKLNRLKSIRAIRHLEDLKRKDLKSLMYGAPADDQDQGGF